MRDTKDTTINKYLLVGMIILAVIGGAYAGYYYTKRHYENKSSQEYTKNQEGLVCQAEIRKGRKGDIKSEYFIFENSDKQEDCERFIDYKNLPEDTESVWLGF